MNNNDERDYAEEEYNRHFMEQEGKDELEGDIREAFKEGKTIVRYFYTSYPTFNMSWTIHETDQVYDENVAWHRNYGIKDKDGNVVFVYPKVHFTAESLTDSMKSELNVPERFFYTVVHKLDNKHNNW